MRLHAGSHAALQALAIESLESESQETRKRVRVVAPTAAAADAERTSALRLHAHWRLDDIMWCPIEAVRLARCPSALQELSLCLLAAFARATRHSLRRLHLL
jgi:hypothetical protein